MLSECPHCSSPRYRNTGEVLALMPLKKDPQATIKYLPISAQLASFFCNDYSKALIRYRWERTTFGDIDVVNERTSDEGSDLTYKDIFDGKAYKQIHSLLPGPNDIVLSIFTDGFSIFKQ